MIRKNKKLLNNSHVMHGIRLYERCMKSEIIQGLVSNTIKSFISIIMPH